MIYRRLKANKMFIPRWMNFVRAISAEGFGRIKYYSRLRTLMDTDRSVRQFIEQETDGTKLLEIVKSERPETEVVMITAFGSIDAAVEAMHFSAGRYPPTGKISVQRHLLGLCKRYRTQRSFPGHQPSLPAKNCRDFDQLPV